MKPLICYSIRFLDEFDSYGDFEGYEIRNLAGYFNIIKIMKLKDKLKGNDLSLHSQLGRVFSCKKENIPEFAEAELNILKSEIIVSKIFGVKQINLHMKEEEFSEEEIRQFNEIIDFAESKGIEIIYENHVCSEEIILRVLETFPRLKFCLDFGHLNAAIYHKNFNMDIYEFLDKVKERLVHIHAHNNHGEKDEHNSLDNGNFPWKEVLEKLKGSNLRKIILENKEEKDSYKSKELVEDFYGR